MEGLIEGRIVHYVLEEFNRGTHRPAIITRVHGQTDDHQCNLQVFLDAATDYPEIQVVSFLNCGMLFVPCAPFDDIGQKPGTWHWIEGSRVKE